jgi:OmcA/MtrC family decaheme c-type cytochrome
MVHKIHSGLDGYKIVGFNQRLFDFSNVEFAPPTNNVKNCTVCHQGADSARYTVPSRAACGSCHTAVDFPSHMGGQTDDTNCGNCHQKVDVERFHSPLYDTSNNVLFDGKKLEVKIDDVTNVVAGGRPVITFSVKVNDAAADITVANTIHSLSFTIAGPTTDYSGPGAPAAVGYIRYTVVNNGAAAAGVAATGTAGQFTYTPPDTLATPKLADDASGTVGVGLEATIRERKMQGTLERTMDHAVQRADVRYFAVGGGTAVPRRSTIDNAKCNNCHIDLGMHGTRARKGVELCVMCHNPNAVNAGRVARYETYPGTGQPWSIEPNSIQFAVMIHKIHAGGRFVKGYTLGGMPTATPAVGDPSATSPGPAGTQVKFEGLFPGDLGNCETCHKPGAYGLPSAQNLATKYETWTCSEPIDRDTNYFCGPPTGQTWTETYWAADASKTRYVLPQKSLCTSCHATPATGAHADLMTLGSIESCNTCHGQGRDADPLVVHRRRP